MRCFKSGEAKKVKTYLRSCLIHDGKFAQAIYDQIQKSFTAHVINLCWNSDIRMEFRGVRQFACTSDYPWCQNNDDISCLVIEDNLKDLPDFIHVAEGDDDLFFVWEMFSGNYIYILCTEFQISCNTLYLH